jgi:hypothetical protein
MTNGKEISTDRGDSAMMRVGQFIEFLEGDDTGGEVKAPLYVDGSGGTLSSGSNSLKIKGQAGADIRDFLFEPFGLNNMSFLSNIAQGKQVSVSTEGNVDGFSTTVATLITTSSITLGTGEITPGDNTIYTFVFSPSTDADIPENTQITFVLSNTNIVTGNSTTHKRFLSESNTTATIVEHGDDFNVRRPILQKVELNDNSKKTIMHFDRSVIPFTANHDSGIRQMMALFDPLTIKSVETITEVEDGVTKYYQKIKLSHEHEFEANDDIIIQNLEEEPIAVNTGLTVLETQPVESNLDIYYESSTSGLIRDLHTDFISQSKELEISYYNTFILSGGANLIYSTTENDFVPVEDIGQWHVEESRVKGEYNGKSVDFGVKAYLVDTNYAQRTRGNALIHSGIFNAKTDVNETNQFSIGESITKAVDIQNGSIQKLYAEDTNLIIFQENKVSRALIDKDIIFTQEGQPLTTASKIVIGQVGAFAGDYGISNNPESFAVHAGRKYFSDKNRGVILRLSQDGLTPISDAGMRSFFRDNLQNADRIYGMYDEQKNKYVVSMQNNHGVASTYLPEYGTSTDATTETRDTYATLSFDEGSRGWVSFYTYKPTFGFSIDNKFYTYNLQNLYEHYRDDVQRCMFYKSVYTDPANIEFVFNDEPTTVKNFHTINYEGTSGWKMASSETDMHEAYPILSSDTSVSSLSIPINFVNKENKYYGHVRNNTTTTSLNQITGIDLSGVKGYFNKVKMQYWKPSEAIASSVNKGELYAVGSETVYSSQ